MPLTAILYGPAGTVVQVVRRGAGRDAAGRGRADVGRPGRDQGRPGQEGDIVVARAGALLREGDPVRPVTASASWRSRGGNSISRRPCERRDP